MSMLILRRCCKCGLEAKTVEDLQLFVSRPQKPYGRDTICKKCFNQKRVKSKIVLPYLRKCTVCGLEAHNEEELKLFIQDKGGLFGYRNICKKCDHEIYGCIRKSEKYKRSPLLVCFDNMIFRCYNPKYIGFHNYGGRGITVCDEWRSNKQAFVDWANSHGFKPELTIDRINNNGNYSPDNCRWVTHAIQSINTRRTTTDLVNRTRICSICRKKLPFSKFQLDRSDCAGINSRCRECNNKHRREHR